MALLPSPLPTSTTGTETTPRRSHNISSRDAVRWFLAGVLLLCLVALYTENINLCRAVSTTQSSTVTTLESSLSLSSVVSKTPYNTTIRAQKRSLPTFRNGGVVVFYHNPKTGGMSVRHNFAKLRRIQQNMLGYNGKTVKQQWGRIDDILMRRIDTDESIGPPILFLELHGPVQGVLPLYTQLRRWREMAAEHGTGFFSFSLVRQPVDFMVSYFNFFWSEPCLFASGCPYKLYPSTEAALVETAHADLQCLYYSRDITWRDFKMHSQSERSPPIPLATASECAAVQDVLLNEMDWVGLTENLSNETMPLLQQMLLTTTTTTTLDSQQEPTIKVFNQVKAQKEDIVTVESLKPATVEYLKKMSAHDQAIYKAVQEHFTMDMWEDWTTD